MQIKGKIKKIFPFYVKGNRRMDGGWVVIEICSKTPEKLITEKNEMAIINLDMGEHDFKTTNGYFSIFFEKIPEGFEKGKDVRIKVEIDD